MDGIALIGRTSRPNPNQHRKTANAYTDALMVFIAKAAGEAPSRIAPPETVLIKITSNPSKVMGGIAASRTAASRAIFPRTKLRPINRGIVFAMTPR